MSDRSALIQALLRETINDTHRRSMRVVIATLRSLATRIERGDLPATTPEQALRSIADAFERSTAELVGQEPRQQ